jgi:hexokinase
MNNKCVKDFLKKVNLTAESIDSEKLLQQFETEMEKGLSGKDSSLAMIASYVSAEGEVPIDKPVIVLDAGGTNLRVCTVSFDQHGKADIEHFEKYTMPGISSKLTKEEFYNLLCDYLKPVINKADSIGFCFSYPTEITPEKDGKLLYWTKEVKVPELVGEYIGKGLNDALESKGYPKKKITILNDTVAALLAGKAIGEVRKCSDYVGFILGTGTNTAYVEKNENIAKINLNSGTQVINVESGNFDKCSQSSADINMDNNTENPGKYIFEKMIAGRYLGAVALEAIKLAAEEGLLSETAKLEIENLKELETVDVSIFLENPFNAVAIFSPTNYTKSDKEVIYYILSSLVERSAKLTAINIASAIIKSGSGNSPLKPVCINIDGSTYHKLYSFSEKCEAFLRDILNRRDLYFYPINLDNAPILGSAIAGLLA